MYGFVKVGAAVPVIGVGAVEENVKQIASLMHEAARSGVEIVVFPEMSLTGYTCGDLFFQQALLEGAKRGLGELLEVTRGVDTIGIVGLPLEYCNELYNVAVVFQQGKVLGVVPKTYLPNYGEFQEQRWFRSGKDLMGKNIEIELFGGRVKFGSMVFRTPNTTFGVELCEDLWSVIPPSSYSTLQSAELMFNLSANDAVVGKRDYLKSLVLNQSARCISGYIYASSGFGESTTDLVFSGNAFICENGELLEQSKQFVLDNQLIISDIDVETLRAERRRNTTFASSRYLDNTCVCECAKETRLKFSLTREINPLPFVPSSSERDHECWEAFSIQTVGLVKRLMHTGAKCAVIGVSGGLDSTLALMVTVNAFDRLGIDRKGIVAITMPGFGTSDRTYKNAVELINRLGVTFKEISIKEACLQHFKDISQDADVHDVTYENSQARERTQILMDVANQVGGLVIGTGDMSELALGWATYNGDHMSMYGVNASVPKTLVQSIVGYLATTEGEEIGAILRDVLATPISPELTPVGADGKIAQKTEETVGPYELHDFFMYYFLRYGMTPNKILYLALKAFKGRYDNETIKRWLKVFVKRFFSQQFKRSCMPDGPKVECVSLSPRGDWRMPSDAICAEWLKELE